MAENKIYARCSVIWKWKRFPVAMNDLHNGPFILARLKIDMWNLEIDS